LNNYDNERRSAEYEENTEREAYTFARRRRKHLPVFWLAFICVFAVLAVTVAIINIYIHSRLSEYESAQPMYLAQSVFDEYFANPDFETLIEKTGYVLSYAETQADAVNYFKTAAANGEISFTQVTSAFEAQEDALVYIVRAGNVNFAKLSLVPTGETTKHGSVLYELGELMLIRRERPEPVLPEEKTVPVYYSAELQAQYETFVLEAIRAYAKQAVAQSGVTALKYYEPGSDPYKRLGRIDVYTEKWVRYSLENESASEFRELENGVFSCRVNYTARLKATGREDELHTEDYTLFLRPNAAGKYLIYAQYVTGADIPADVYAEKPAESLYLNISSESPVPNISDKDVSTYEAFGSGDSLTAAGGNIHTVYIVWQEPPSSPAALEADGKTYALGAYGFLHEIVRLDAPVSSFKLSFASEARVAEIYAYSNGVLPPQLQDWNPPLLKTDLLVVVPQIGDELTQFGGLLPLFADKEFDVQVATLTRPDEAGTVLYHEFLDALWMAGVRNYPVSGPFIDSDAARAEVFAAENEYSREKVLDYQVQLLRRFKPEVAITAGIYGGDGYGIRTLCAGTLLDAVYSCGNSVHFPNSAAAFGLWEVKLLYLRGYDENMLILDYSAPLSSFGGASALSAAKTALLQYSSGGVTGEIAPDSTNYGLIYGTADDTPVDLF
jgi:hypothetical protein